MTELGWYPDPTGRHEKRFFDGRQWTDHVADGSTLGTEPVFAPPGPPMEPPVMRPRATLDYTSAPRPATRPTPKRVARRRGRFVAAVVLLAVAVGAVAFAFLRDESKDGSTAGPAKSSTTRPPATTTLRALTGEVGNAVDDIVCGAYSYGCTVDMSITGVVSVTILGDVSEADLAAAGRKTGLWNAADASRMMRTRALDGTLSSANNGASWTYHPDHGLQIVLDVTVADLDLTS